MRGVFELIPVHKYVVEIDLPALSLRAPLIVHNHIAHEAGQGYGGAEAPEAEGVECPAFVMVAENPKHLGPLRKGGGEIVIVYMVYLADIGFAMDDVFAYLEERGIVRDEPRPGQKAFMPPVALGYVYEEPLSLFAQLLLDTEHQVVVKGNGDEVTAC